MPNTPYGTLEMVNAALVQAQKPDGSYTFQYKDLAVAVNVANHTIRHVRLIAPMSSPHIDLLRGLSYELVTTLLSETTNNDACDVTVRERSGHLNDHEDLPAHVRRGHQRRDAHVVVDAKVEDELS